MDGDEYLALLDQDYLGLVGIEEVLIGLEDHVQLFLLEHYR